MTAASNREGRETPKEFGIITTCLGRVRRRLWITRLVERCTVALAWGAGASLPIIGARLLYERVPVLAWTMAIIPAAVGGWTLWQSARGRLRNARPGTLRFLRTCAVMATIASVAACVLLLQPTLHRIPMWAIPTAISAAFVLVAAITARPITTRAAAIFIDQQAGLQEKVATALEFMTSDSAETGMQAAFRKPVAAAAVDACHTVRTAKVAYTRAGSRLYAIAAAAALIAGGISFLPPLPASARPSRQPYVAVVEKSKKLEDILNDLEQKKGQQNPIAEKKLQPLKDALTDLRKGNMSPFEADARLSQEKGDLQKSQEEMDAAEKVEKALDSIKGMEDVARAENQVKDAAMKESSAGASDASGKTAAQKAVDAAAKSVGDKMKNGGMSGAEKDKLAGDLQKAAAQAKGDGQLQQSLEHAAEAAQKGDGDQLAQSLSAAGERTGEQRADQQMSGDAVRQAMEAIDRATGNGSNSDSSQDQSASSGPQQGGGNDSQGGQQSGQQGGSQNGQQQSASGQGQQNQQGSQDGQGEQQGQGSQGGQSGSRSAAGQQTGSQSSGGQAGAGSQQMGGGGSTNLHAPSGPGDHQAGHPVGGTGEYVKVYDEKTIQSQGRTEQVSGKINPLGAASGTQQILGQGDKGDPTIQTYESQLPTARKRALDDLQTQQIPPQYRDLIRNYYGQ